MGNTAITIAAVGVDTGGGVDELVKASAGDATAGYLDAKVDGTTITVSANTLSTIDGGINHNALLNTHNLTTDIDHNTILNNHNLTTDIDHDQLTNFTAAEHFTMLDEDDMVSNSDTQAATQQSIKAYVDAAALGQVEVFSTSGTWTCPTGVNYILVSLIGGGGGGGGGRNNSPHNSGTGGGAGATILNYMMRVTPASTYAVTVGAAGSGGASGASAGSPGTAGGNSSMVGDDFTLTAGGGGGGFGGQSSDQDVVGAGGAGSIDDNAITNIKTLMNAPGPNAAGFTATVFTAISWPGGDGGDSASDSSRDGGAGGNSMFGRGGNGGDFSASSAATAGTGIGSGGGGGRGSGGSGAAGTQGLVIISYAVNGAPS